jgi:predicted extracellular nuclease
MNHSLKFIVAIICLVLLYPLARLDAQKQVKAGIVAFYNLENLYDTINDPNVNDEEFLPGTAKNWNAARYNTKLANMSKVISQLGQADGLKAPAILGVCELENRAVLNDLVAQPSLKPYDYKIVHHDSPDKRGIDVALLYQPLYFKVIKTQAVPLVLIDEDSNQRVFTRDILVVSGLFDGEPMHFIVNHWPSRRGGNSKGNFRLDAAKRCRSIVDSIMQTDKKAKVVVMGDFNDDPTDVSVVEGLGTVDDVKKLTDGKMYNAMAPFFKNGVGTLAYRGKWNLFDQLILSESLVSNKTKGYRFLRGRVYNESYLIRDEGQYKGYPLRTYGGNDYLGGYSDHLPVYIVLVK